MTQHSDDPGLFKLFTEIGIINQLSTTMVERALPHGLTVAQFSLLNHLSARDPQPPLQLAKAFQVSKGTMTSTIGRLVSKGFVAVTPNSKDGRGKFVAITPAGLAARIASLEAIAPTFGWLVSKIDVQELQTLNTQLEAIRKLLDAQRDAQK